VTVTETAGVWKEWKIRDVREGDVTNSTLPRAFLDAPPGAVVLSDRHPGAVVLSHL
jgi:hypothetical protein